MAGPLGALRRIVFHALSLGPQPTGNVSLTSLAAFSTLQRGLSFSIQTDPLLAQPRRIAVGVSGGVDSAVAAMLLKRAGHDVVGVFMRNWDEAEETGNRNCSIEADLRDAKAVCRQLQIPLHEADFVSQYWTQVFTSFLAECERGLTPNPDLACNRHIKFGSLLEFAASLDADTVATGHYARLLRTREGGVSLLRGVDHTKDQSYFLASVHPEALRHVVFPLGALPKAEVRRIAAEAGLAPADKRSSAGICFIGRRNFADFMRQYVAPVPGRMVDVDSGRDLGPCLDMNTVTHGQRPGIGGASDRVYVAGKDLINRVVYVAQGRDHPALFTRSACLRPPHWLSAQHAQQLAETGSLQCEYKARYGQKPAKCTLRVLRSEEEVAQVFTPSRYCVLRPADAAIEPGSVLVEFDAPAMAITPQQQFVMYDGELCLGSAPIAMPGSSLHESEQASTILGSGARQAAVAV